MAYNAYVILSLWKPKMKHLECNKPHLLAMPSVIRQSFKSDVQAPEMIEFCFYPRDQKCVNIGLDLFVLLGKNKNITRSSSLWVLGNSLIVFIYFCYFYSADVFCNTVQIVTIHSN